MTANPRTLEFLQVGVNALFERGTFRNGRDFRPTQADALLAYHQYLFSNELSPEEKLKGFFEIPTGVGKTALFLAILDEAHRVARANNDQLRAMIVVPTITILEQMKGNAEKKGEIEEWAPDYLKTVGYYGGDYRDIGEELTIIIYNSWVTLMEQGLIDSTNIDILISDEAHRGTSERRLTNQFNAFANGTAQIAFTATARFDDEKSVEQSHGHQIFSRGVGESVRLGELAAYIQTQLHVIRIDPKELENALARAFNVYSGSDDIDNPDDPEEDEDQKLKRAIMTGVKQDAWIRDMVSVFGNGKDEHTQEPLTENQSGFYVEGTAMAERLAAVASADPVLQARAKEKGCKGVIAAVHSKMSAADQREIMAAFERGEYLGIASDSKLKEGYNNKKLKNIFDYPRNSLVDKAQIIGRGARQWFNEAKNRFEGSTIIDTIVYVGSDDPERDKQLKDSALRNAVLAWDVLEGTAVYGPAASASKAPPRGGEEPSIEPVYGLNVTSYVSMEDLQTIYARQQKLQEDNRIQFTADMQSWLKDQISRTGKGIRELFKQLKDIPENLTENLVQNWPYGSEVKNVDKNHWSYIMEAYLKMPDTGSIAYTVEMRKQLEKESKRTGKKVTKFIQEVGDLPVGLTFAVIQKLFDTKKPPKSIEERHWNFIIESYKNISDSKYVDLTEEKRNFLKSEIQRTGIGAITLLKSSASVPKGLKPSHIQTWISDMKLKRLKRDHWSFVVEHYGRLSDGLKKAYKERVYRGGEPKP